MKKHVLTRIEAIEDTIQVRLENVEKHAMFISDIFTTVSDCGVNIDMISSIMLEDEMRIEFTCDQVYQKELNQAISLMKQNHPRIVIYLSRDVGKLIVEGDMRDEIGVAAAVFKVLGDARIPFLQVTTSEVSMSFVIEKDYLKQAEEKMKEAVL